MYKCPFCGKVFEKESSLIKHIRKLHIGFRTCPACGRKVVCFATHGYHKYRRTGDILHGLIWVSCRTAFSRFSRLRQLKDEIMKHFKIEEQLAR